MVDTMEQFPTPTWEFAQTESAFTFRGTKRATQFHQPIYPNRDSTIAKGPPHPFLAGRVLPSPQPPRARAVNAHFSLHQSDQSQPEEGFRKVLGGYW